MRPPVVELEAELKKWQAETKAETETKLEAAWDCWYGLSFLFVTVGDDDDS
jgi:hypothetical protein